MMVMVMVVAAVVTMIIMMMRPPGPVLTSAMYVRMVLCNNGPVCTVPRIHLLARVEGRHGG